MIDSGTMHIEILKLIIFGNKETISIIKLSNRNSKFNKNTVLNRLEFNNVLLM